MKNLLKIPVILLSFIIFFEGAFAQSVPIIDLEAYKRIDQPARKEVSGIVKSQKYEDTFWVHGDSGTPDRIYAINSNGEIKSENKEYKGTEVKGAKNKDWEDITSGNDGTLIVADFGNNCYCREDLKLFVIEEPDPADEEVNVIFEYEIKYPERTGLLSLIIEDNHNAEAIFVQDGEIYIITKNEGGNAYLFRLRNPSIQEVNILEEVERFNFRGLVTAADISQDESKLVVLTYNRIWLFELEEGKSFFEGKTFGARIRGAKQVESITFDEDNLIIAEENGDLYQVSILELGEID